MALDVLARPELWVAAFAGGAFGAALGALPAFALMGFMIIAGEVANILGAELSDAVGAMAPGDIGVGITGSVAFGPVLGPHVAFAGGVAATAYAARKGYVDTGFDYHAAKDITSALGTRPDVLAVGGAFGVLGVLVRRVSGSLGLPVDPIALAILLSALAHRLFLGYPLIGRIQGNGLLDMTPFEREETRRPPRGGDTIADGGTARADAVTERFAVEPWLPHQYEWANVATIGLVTGVLGGYIAVVTGSAFLAFGISAATLVFLNCGVEKVPVTHHMTLPASTAALAATSSGSALVAGVGPTGAVLVGAVFGMVCALFAELFQRVFYAHGDTHWDPPAAGIAFGTFLIAVLYLVGVFPSHEWIPMF